MASQQEPATAAAAPLSGTQIFQTWWPLAASWVLMALELPVLSAVIARLGDPEIHLAAYGGIVFPLALLIESPVIMLLAASTALSRDWASYLFLRRFTWGTGLALTALHALLAFTPLYFPLVEGLIEAPGPIVAPARLGLMIMLPWTLAIAYRRFLQGILIRWGRPRAVSVGTALRLAAEAAVLGIGYWVGKWPGIVVATSAVISGVLTEALYVGIQVRPLLRGELSRVPPVDPPLNARRFARFYVPLALTSLLTLVIQPMGAAALSRMPRPLESLAAWPVVFGLIFLARCMGIAYQEVVVSLLDRPRALPALRRFTRLLTLAATGFLVPFALSPLGNFWFSRLSGLNENLSSMAQTALLFGLLLPALSVLQHWYQGILVHHHQTAAVTQAVVIFLLSSAALLTAGVLYGSLPGVYVGLAAFSLAGLLQTGWVQRRALPHLKRKETP